MQPEKIDLTHTSISDEKLSQLRDLLPEVFHEGKINWDELHNALGDYVEEDPRNERFGLRWPGKSKLQQVINTPSVCTLVPQPEESVTWDTTGNIIIEGDNLEVLKLLQKSYAGKIKMIYIDPPYNTGNDFVYPDKYASGLDTYLEYTGQVDGEGRKVATNSEASGRYHADWLNMMYPRLYLARNLLQRDGVIFVSIDEHELSNLLQIADQVFGEDSHVVNVVWKKRSTPPNDQIIGANHEYVVIFARSGDDLSLNLRPRTDTQIARYRNPDNHRKGSWTPGDLQANVKGGRYVSTLYYPIVNPRTGDEHFPGERGNWRFNRAKMQELIDNDEIYFGEDDRGRPKLKRFLQDVKDGITYASIWDFVPMNTRGSQEMAEFFGDSTTFESPKPTGFIAQLLQLGSSGDEVVLDFFAGSGTTGHAVMQQNAEDGGNRKFILVQLPEPMEQKVLADGTKLNTIADVTRERVRRAGRKIRAELSPGQGGGGIRTILQPILARNRCLGGKLPIGHSILASAPTSWRPVTSLPGTDRLLIAI